MIHSSILKKSRHMLLVLFLFTVCTLSLVAQGFTTYKVQIGSFKSPDLAKLSNLTTIGSVYSEQAPNGMTRIVLGYYGDRQSAQRDRDMASSLGYPNAFIKLHPENEAQGMLLLSAQHVAAPTMVESNPIATAPSTATPSPIHTAPAKPAPPTTMPVGDVVMQPSPPAATAPVSVATPANLPTLPAGHVYHIALGDYEQITSIPNTAILQNIGDVFMEQRNGKYHIILSSFDTAQTVEAALQQAIAKGFSNAKVITAPKDNTTGAVAPATAPAIGTHQYGTVGTGGQNTTTASGSLASTPIVSSPPAVPENLLSATENGTLIYDNEPVQPAPKPTENLTNIEPINTVAPFARFETNFKQTHFDALHVPVYDALSETTDATTHPQPAILEVNQQLKGQLISPELVPQFTTGQNLNTNYYGILSFPISNTHTGYLVRHETKSNNINLSDTTYLHVYNNAEGIFTIAEALSLSKVQNGEYKQVQSWLLNKTDANNQNQMQILRYYLKESSTDGQANFKLEDLFRVFVWKNNRFEEGKLAESKEQLKQLLLLN